MFSFMNHHKEKKEVTQTMDKEILTTPQSPKVVRERKSRDVDPSTIKSPRSSRRTKDATGDMRKVIYDNNACCWSLKYQVENAEFAKGAYGKILLATDKVTGKRVVIKKIPQTTSIRLINNEVRAGKIIGCHSNIPGLLQYIDKPDFHYLIFEYVNGQDLFCYLEKQGFTPRKESEARSIITQIIRALLHIHSVNIAHRDIKLENLMIDPSGRVYVIDMGLCAFVEEGKLCKEWCGSDNYLAPEICRRIPYDGFKADVFSTGVVLFALLYGVFPFENLRVNVPQDPVRSKRLSCRFPADVKVSKSAQDLLSKMLEDDASKRISMQEIMNHEWMTQDNELPELKFKSSESTQLRA